MPRRDPNRPRCIAPGCDRPLPKKIKGYYVQTQLRYTETEPLEHGRIVPSRDSRDWSTLQWIDPQGERDPWQRPMGPRDKEALLPHLPPGELIIGRPRDYGTGINYFRTWDGVSYADGPFCSNKCAIAFAHLAARTGCRFLPRRVG